jgi:hypothetical protein
MEIGETISADEYRKRYQTPQPAQKKTLLQKLGSFGEGLGKVLGGNVIGEALGTAIANRSGAARQVENAPAITHNGQTIVPAGNGQPLFQGPSGKAVAGDALKAATSIASAALPGVGGAAEGAGLGAKAANLGLRAAEGAGYGYASDVSQRLIQNDQGTFKPGLGTALGTLFPFASTLIGSLTKRGVALTTGAGRDVIDRALHNPDAVGDAISKYAKTDASKQGLVSRAKTAIYDFLSERSDEFGTNVKQTTFTKPFTKAEITSAFSDELSQFKGQITRDGLKFNSTPLTEKDQGNLQKFYKQLKSWTDFTPGGVEDLRQAITNHISEFQATGNTRADVILGNLKKFVTSGLEDRAPGYGEHLATYTKKTQLANDVLKELNASSGNSKPSTQLNSVMRLFKKDPDVIKGLTTIMGKDEADNFLNELSGAILSEWLPSGSTRQVVESFGTLGGILGVLSGGLHAVPTAAAIASASPRIVGTVATNAGRALQAGVGTGARRAATIAAGRYKP